MAEPIWQGLRPHLQSWRVYFMSTAVWQRVVTLYERCRERWIHYHQWYYRQYQSILDRLSLTLHNLYWVTRAHWYRRWRLTQDRLLDPRHPLWRTIMEPLSIYLVLAIARHLLDADLRKAHHYIPSTVISVLARGGSFWQTYLSKTLSMTHLRASLALYTQGIRDFDSYHEMVDTITRAFPPQSARIVQTLVEQLYSSNSYTKMSDVADPYHSCNLLHAHRATWSAPQARGNSALLPLISKSAVGAILRLPYALHQVIRAGLVYLYVGAGLAWVLLTYKDLQSTGTLLRPQTRSDLSRLHELYLVDQPSLPHPSIPGASWLLIPYVKTCEGLRFLLKPMAFLFTMGGWSPDTHPGSALCMIGLLSLGKFLVTLALRSVLLVMIYPEPIFYYGRFRMYRMGSTSLFPDRSSAVIFYRTLYSVLQKTPWVRRYSNDLYTRLAINTAKTWNWRLGGTTQATVYDDTTHITHSVGYAYQHSQNPAAAFRVLSMILPYGIALGGVSHSTIYPFSLRYFEELRGMILQAKSEESPLHLDQWRCRGYSVEQVAGGITLAHHAWKMISVLGASLLGRWLNGQSRLALPFLHLPITYYVTLQSLKAQRDVESTHDRSLNHACLYGFISATVVGVILGSPLLWSMMDYARTQLGWHQSRHCVRWFWPISRLSMGRIMLGEESVGGRDPLAVLIDKLNDLIYYYEVSCPGFMGSQHLWLQLLMGSVDV